MQTRRKVLEIVPDTFFAYVLVGNHVHLLVSSDKSGQVSLAMRQLGQVYVTAFNRRHRRTGTLWEGRFKSCLVDSDRYLLTAYRYIELNPVRAAMVEEPEHHHWSSVHANLARCEDSLVTPHPCFIAMGNAPLVRADAYRAWLKQGVGDDELIAIRQHLQQERAFGSKRFQAMAEGHWAGPSACVDPGGRGAWIPRRSAFNFLRPGFGAVSLGPLF